MQRDAHQTTFAARLYIGNHKKRLLLQLAILENANTPGAFGKNHAAIRRPNNRPWHFQSAYHCLNSELDRALSGSLTLTLFRRDGTGFDLTRAASGDALLMRILPNDLARVNPATGHTTQVPTTGLPYGQPVTLAW